MKFHIGPVPENASFRPEDGGWNQLKEPSPWVAQICSVPLGLCVFVGVVAAWGMILTHSEILARDPRRWLISLCLAFIAAIPVHECIHAVCHPFHGRSSDTILGVWPSMILVYAHYDAEMSRNRFLLMLMAPFLALTLAPLAVCAMFSIYHPVVVWISIANSAASALDLFGVALVGLQIPASAIVRNKGWNSWWRNEEYR